MPAPTPIQRLKVFLQTHPRLFVLTGAGISTASGIPDYRDENGDWKRPAPVQYRDFVDQAATRRRYWARSLIGWPWFQDARPNLCHQTLADWESAGGISQLVTQNVDRLHQGAGSHEVIDLHGRLDRVICLDCRALSDRAALQEELLAVNPEFAALSAEIAPDGDAYLEHTDYRHFRVPDCPHCGGILKPDVVFFGETIPRERVDRSISALLDSDALLVIGSSLMVYSGFRFCRLAAEHGIPIAAINPGRTRADELIDLKLTERFEDVIPALGEFGKSADTV
ncbi:MAG: NAD-dependent protein deacetylase [Gammaproteobacteria bacterium]|nr:NAD-dependent protein deacetylase [Gammaproteobacteria bacterium]